MVRCRGSGWWLGLLVGAGSPLVAQAAPQAPRVELRENYPNPFFPATTIPFVISQEVCAGSRKPVVSLKVYNVLVQVVAIPVLERPSGPRSPKDPGPRAGERLDSLRLDCGRYRAFWDGR